MHILRISLPIDTISYAASYTLDDAKFAGFEKFIKGKIREYDPSFGPYLVSHLERTANQLKGFMIESGLDPVAADKITRAFQLHDAGKILQDISLWQLMKEKPSAEIKTERKKHCDLGAEALDSWIGEWGQPLTKDDKKHIELIRHFMKFHHERMDGSGPHGFNSNEMDIAMRMATIIDEIDGKLKIEGNTREAIFGQLRDKHAGKFDDDMVDAFERYAVKHKLFEAQAKPAPALAIPSVS